MPKTFSYADAVKLLGAKESAIVAALDKIVGGALLSGATLGLSNLLSWFDAKVDFIRLSHQLLTKAAEKRSGLSRYSQTERVQAAHAVLVVVAFFEAVDDLKLAVPLRELGFDRNRQLAILGLTDLFDRSWPLPSPSLPYEVYRQQLMHQYRKSSADLHGFYRACAVWDELNETQQSALADQLATVATRAVNRYEELWRQVAGSYPELRFWVQLQEGMATRAALGRLETTLNELVVGRGPDARRVELARKYRALLDRPIVDPTEVLPGLQIPPMGRAYVDPDFQVFPFYEGAQPAALGWWSSYPVRSDLHRYLVGYLTSPKAVATPLLVLGDPGSGKSMLTKVLAARLPATDFLTVRVELRNTPTEADLVDQIQHGLRAALQEDLSWADLARSSGDALPVVLLDGFDELLQATGVSHTRYLARVEQFQRDRAETGHPVAVVVTSRISVCGGVHIPAGADVLRLVPFKNWHVTSWLDGWNTANASYFARTGLAPLTPAVVLRYRDLAAQPLLLLMLALYDAAGNALQKVQGRIGEADLYERLLSMFAKREVAKNDADRTAADLDGDIEAELERLSVVAFAMFNRGTQWVTEADLNKDLAGLLDIEHTDRRPGMHSPLSPGEAVLGRFFFVQRSEALRDTHTLRTYEFLHATFGEFLVARFTVRVLHDLHRVGASRPRRLAGTPIDDGELFALLSFAPLTSRRPVINFLAELTHTDPERFTYAELVRRLFAVAQEGHPRSHTAYEPVPLPVPARHAIYSLNLVLLATALTGKLNIRPFGITDWQRLTAFWKSQLPIGEWNTLIRTLNVAWRDIYDGLLTLGLITVPRISRDHSTLPDGDFEPLLESHFTADRVSNHLRYPLESMLRQSSYRSEYVKAIIDLHATRRTPNRAEWYLAVARAEPELVIDELSVDPDVAPDVLDLLAKEALGQSMRFWSLVCDRIGRGGPDHELLEIVGRRSSMVLSGPTNVVDAWLRLHEIGFEFPENRQYPDVATLLRSLDMSALAAIRPDLGARASRALADLDTVIPELEHGPATVVLRAIREDRWLPPNDPQARIHYKGGWQEQLRMLDTNLVNGGMSAEEYRHRREQLLAYATGRPQPPQI